MSDPMDVLLRELAADVRTEPPDPALAQRLLRRLETVPAHHAPRRLPRRAWAAALLAALLLVGVALSPVGASVAGWFGFHGVVVEEQPAPSPTGTPVVPPEQPGTSLERAAELAGFVPLVPEALGDPDAVSVSRDRRIVSLTWGSGAHTVRLDEFDGTLEPLFVKRATDAVRVDVLGGEALWFPTPHGVTVRPQDGGTRTVPPRLAAQTLIWPRGLVTLRLEGVLTLERAVDVADSVD